MKALGSQPDTAKWVRSLTLPMDIGEARSRAKEVLLASAEDDRSKGAHLAGEQGVAGASARLDRSCKDQE